MNDPNFVPSIDIIKFKYIICDECHFFTSDASFNRETNKILKEIVSQGQNAVRVYMSATPKVALEAILREEFEIKQNQVDCQLKKLDEEINAIESLRVLHKMLKIKGLGKTLKKKCAELEEEKVRLEEQNTRL